MPLPFRLAAYYCAHFVHAGLFMAYFPLWLAWRGFDALEIAWVLALPQIMRTFAPAGWGLLADRTGALRGLVVLSCAGFALGFAALPFAQSFAAVSIVIGISSLISAGALPLVEAITLRALSGQPGRYGPIRLWGSVGFIAAVLAGGAWLDAAPVAALPWGMLGFALATLVAAFSLPGGGARVQSEPVPWRLDGAALRLLACGFCMAAAHGTLYAFFTLHLERSGYRVSTIGLLWTLGVVAEIVVFVCLPQLFRRFALSTILAASFGCAVVRFLLLGWLADALWLVVIAQLLHAGTFGAFHAAAVSAAHRVLPQAALARGQTLFSSVTYGAGGAVGALAAGGLWQLGGAGLAFSLSALSGLVGLHFARGLKRAGV
jgi:PPP family 3-phenylpropionic acid transporter